MKFSPCRSLLFLFSLSSFSFAQEIDEASAEQLKKNEKSLKAIAEAAVETQKNYLDRKIDPDYKRVLELQKKQAAFLSDFAEGKVRPFPNAVKNWDSYISQVSSLTTSYSSYLAAATPEEKDKLAGPLLTALQPLGWILKNADHGNYQSRNLSKKELDEQDQLMEDFNTLPSSNGVAGLKLMSPSVMYTLKDLPITLMFSAPKNTEILLQSEVGGEFANKLDYIRIKADDNGIASTTWISHGDGVAACNILYRSPEYPTKGVITPIVKKLKLVPLEHISPVVK